MSKKPSLAEALQSLDRSTPAAKAVIESASKPHKPRSVQPPSRAGKKPLIGYFSPEVSKQLKQIALDRDTTLQELLGEALNDFFQKYKKPTLA
jgi:hypothetical protein